MSERKDELQTQLMELLHSSDYHPLKRSEIAQQFSLDSADRRTLRYVLRTLEAEGKILMLSKKRVALPGHGDVITGKLVIHQRGFGFLKPDVDQDHDIDGEIYVPPDGLGAARHTDRVTVSVFESDRQSGRSPAFANTSGKVYEGRVTEIVERGFTEVVGLLIKKSSGWLLIPDNGRLEDIGISAVASHVQRTKNHKVVVELDEPPFPGAPLTGTVVEDLGAMNEPGVDMISLMRMYDLEQHFSKEVMAATKKFSQQSIAEISEGRTDLREWVTFTIDPVDARDFDDALSLRKLENGHWQIGVHIADVSAFVGLNGIIDQEAQRRATSVYLVDRVVTMLPEKLTNELCSLRPKQDRLAHSVLIEVDEDGTLQRYDTCKSVIHSKARLHYGQAQQFLDENVTKGIPDTVQASLRELFPLTRKIRQARFASGSMIFESTEVKCILDEEGKVAKVEKRTSQEANQLVEECMLMANKVVAMILNSHELTSGIYRIHEPPSEKQWGNMALELRLLGIHEPPESREDINRILGGDLPEHLVTPITISILRNLNRALYSPKLNEHFGLAFDNYSHFTSPIRRYPDLMAHRMLEAIEQDRPPPYSFADVKGLASHCSEREGMAEEAEKTSVQMKLVAYYHDLLWKGETGPFDACVTGIVSRGLLIELTDTLQRGLVPFQSIGGDYFEVNSTFTRAKGTRSGLEFGLGERVRVVLTKVDTRNRLIDFALEDYQESNAPDGGQKRRGKGRGKSGPYKGKRGGSRGGGGGSSGGKSRKGGKRRP